MFFLLFIVLPVGRSATAGPLQPDELLLIYNGNSAASRQLAEYYAQVRQVPLERLCPVQVRAGVDDISREDFEHHVREPIRGFIREKGLSGRVRCLLTFYDVPIRVRRVILTETQQELLRKWQSEFSAQLEDLDRALDALEALGLPPGRHIADTPPTKDANQRYNLLVERYKRLRVAVYSDIAPKLEKNEGSDLLRSFMEKLQSIEGIANVVQQLQAAGGPGRNDRARSLAQAKAAFQREQDEVNAILAGDLEDLRREEARMWLRRNRGLIGAAGSLRVDINSLRVDESEAAIDSELMLVLWDRYPLYRWVSNLNNWRLRVDPDVHESFPKKYWDEPPLMTARLDAATPAVVRRMIDDAVFAEKTGLVGRAYVDMRGLNGTEGYGKYDADLRRFATMIPSGKGLEVVTDNHPAVFAARCCGDAALYCGWYSVRQYVPAFRFRRGSIGFHIASFEAVNLRHPSERGWCKGLLDAGVAATLGPVAEPYLESFPSPTEFFGLLLTGKLTLAECYAATVPFASWMQMLLGDPLYCPFRDRPYLTLTDVFEPRFLPAEYLQASSAVSPSSTSAPP